MRRATLVRDERIDELERCVAELSDRVRALETTTKPRKPIEDEEFDDFQRSEPSVGAEYWIGARLLPRVGAIIIILGIAFVAISEASKNESVSRAALLLIEAVICLAFILVGEWKRDELEGFGTTLSAIGACGLYLTAAGGHFAYKSVSAAGMSGVFAGLTILSHSYAVYRRRRLFFVIGASGGLAAMLFSLAEENYLVGLWVYVVVTIAAAVVCAVRKWTFLAFCGWLLGVLILVPVMLADTARGGLIAALYVGSLACIAAYVRAYEGEAYGIAGLGAALAFFATGAVALGLQGGSPGLVHLVPWVAAGVALSLVEYRGRAVAKALLVGSVLTGVLLIPLCAAIEQRVFAYTGVACLVAASGWWLGHSIASRLTMIAFAGAAVSFGYAALTGPIPNEHIHLASLVVAGVLVVLTLRADKRGWLAFAVPGVWLLLARWTFILAPPGAETVRTYSLQATVLMLYAMALLVAGFRRHSGELRMWSIAAIFASVIQIMIFEKDTGVGFRLSALLLLGLTMLVAGFRYLRERQVESG